MLHAPAHHMRPCLCAAAAWPPASRSFQQRLGAMLSNSSISGRMCVTTSTKHHPPSNSHLLVLLRSVYDPTHQAAQQQPTKFKLVFNLLLNNKHFVVNISVM